MGSNHQPNEPEKDKSNQQPSVKSGSFTQIMVNPMQLQDHEFTAWLDRLVETRKNRKDKDHTETSEDHTTMVKRMVT